MIPYRLLNNYYTNQTANGQIMVEMWKQVGLNVEIEMRGELGQIHDPRRRQGRPRLVGFGNSINDPITAPWSCSSARTAKSSRRRTGRTPRSTSSPSSWKPPPIGRSARRPSPACWKSAEREDPVYQVLHQNAVFTGMKSSLKWKAAPAFAVDFRATTGRSDRPFDAGLRPPKLPAILSRP